MNRLVFDIGGTNMRMAVAEGGEVGLVEKIPTSATPEEAIAALGSFVVSANVSPADCVGGIAGIIEEGVVVDSPNLSSWNGFSFSTLLLEHTGLSVRVYNDAALAAFGEAVRGAGRTYERVAYLGIGTGVGGALIVGKSLPLEGESYEPGRLVIDAETGGTFESFVGGAALAAEFGMPPQDLPRSLFMERAHYVATGLALINELWSPDVVILNGSLINDETGFRLSDISEALATRKEGGSLPLVRATFGDTSGLEGAAAV